jgi:hypothetical protein
MLAIQHSLPLERRPAAREIYYSILGENCLLIVSGRNESTATESAASASSAVVRKLLAASPPTPAALPGAPRLLPLASLRFIQAYIESARWRHGYSS